jgi:hypothetical protein
MILRRATIVASTAALAALLVLATAITVLYVAQRDRVLPNTSIGAVDVGGMTSSELRATVQAIADHRDDVETVFTFEERSFPLRGTDVGYGLDVDASAAAALGRGRTGPPGELVERFRALWTHSTFALVETWDDQRVIAWVEEAASQIDRPISHGDIRVDPATREVAVELPHGRAQVLRAQTHQAVIDALVAPGTESRPLPVEVDDALVDADDVLAVADQARRAVAAPVELVHELGTLRFSPADLAALVGLERAVDGDRQTVALTVTPGRLRHVVDMQTAEVVRERARRRAVPGRP